MAGKRLIFGVHLTNRMTEAPRVQQLFTDYGCNIRTRLGIHDADATSCSPMATPTITTTYALTVMAANGCPS